MAFVPLKNIMIYFDLNYRLGGGTRHNADYFTAEDVLRQMDYLDIDRALVWSSDARDWNAVTGNRELLQKIAQYRERLFPCFVITPRDYYEKGTIDFYRSMMAAGEVRALRICPKSDRSPIYECRHVLRELQEFRPIVQIDTRELDVSDYATLETMANSLPDVRFVLGQKVWCDLEAVFNLMKSCGNVYLDTSWLHVRGTYEMVAEHFGVSRLLFATGHKAQNGAAICALAHANLNDDEKEAIAHKNAERLLDIAPLDRKLAPQLSLDEKPLWRALSMGGRLEGVEVIDAHVHQAEPASSYVMPASDVNAAIPNIVKTMDKFGIARSIMMGNRALYADCLDGNREAHEQAKPYRERICGYWVFNPWQVADISDDVLDEEFVDGYYVGFKILPSYWGLRHDDAKFTRLWEYADKHCLPILIHTWNDCEPLRNVVPKYPDAIFVIAHCGGTWGRSEAVAIAREFPNVYLETCGTFCEESPLCDAIKDLGAERFVFGTDAAYHNIAYEMGAFLSMPLPDETLKPILGENLKNILKKRK